MDDELLDLAALLAPLPEGDGAGVDLREDYSPASIYQKLRDARSEARAEERARDSDGEGEGGVAEGWREVRRLAITALETQSKDLEVAAFLTEALVRQAGLAGLSAGARLLAGLLNNFWDAIHPLPDEDGLEGRAAPLGGLAGGESDGTVMQALRRVGLFRRPSGDLLSIYQYEAAHQTAGLADEARREQRFAQGVLALDTVENEARFDRAGLRATAAEAQSARAAWQEFQDALDTHFGSEAPPSRRVAELLDRLAEVANQLNAGDAAAEAAPEPVLEAEAATPGAPAPAAASAGVPLPTGGIAGREQALRTLDQLAAFFQATEPHSFLAYTLSDAARRGRMSLPELLAEVLQDESARTGMLTALGIRPSAMDAQESE